MSVTSDSTSPTASKNNSPPAVPELSRPWWITVGILCLVAGVIGHALIVYKAYSVAYSRLEKTPPDFTRDWPPNLTSQETATFTLQQIGIEASSAGAFTATLARAMPNPKVPALEAAMVLLQPGSQAGQGCTTLVNAAGRAALARLLLGSPYDNARSVKLLRDWKDGAGPPPPKDLTTQQLADWQAKECPAWVLKYRTGLWSAFGGTFWWRSEAKAPADLTMLLLGPQACIATNNSGSSPEQLRCTVLKGLLQSAIDAEPVRSARALGINFLWGPERALVFSLVLLVCVALIALRIKRSDLIKQADWLEEGLTYIDHILSPTRPGSGDPAGLIRSLQLEFYRNFGKSPPGEPLKWSPNVLTALCDLLDATVESLNLPQSHLAQRAGLHLAAMQRQRSFINAVITAFPAIGLVATLHGLISALSRASGIVSGTEEQRFIATELVTSTLSSSFATTLIALVAMAVFVLWNLGEEHRETDLIEDTQQRLLAVYWPGRGVAEAAPATGGASAADYPSAAHTAQVRGMPA